MILDDSGESYDHSNSNQNPTLIELRTYKDINIIPLSTKYTLDHQFTVNTASKYNNESIHEVKHHNEVLI